MNANIFLFWGLSFRVSLVTYSNCQRICASSNAVSVSRPAPCLDRDAWWRIYFRIVLPRRHVGFVRRLRQLCARFAFIAVGIGARATS